MCVPYAARDNGFVHKMYFNLDGRQMEVKQSKLNV